MSVRTKKSTTVVTTADSDGTSPTVSNSAGFGGINAALVFRAVD